MKKLLAVLLAAIMVLAMSSTAFATIEGGTDAAGTQAASVVAIKKSLRLTDSTTGIALYAPSITYQYSLNSDKLTPAELGYDTTAGDNGDLNEAYKTNEKSISDAGITVKDGLTADGRPTVTIASPGTIAFSNTDILAAADNTGEADKNLIVKNLGITTTAGTIPGIYRFKITESIATGSNSRATAGVTQSDNYVADRYLDVYVTYNSSDGLTVSNVVLFRKTDSATTKTEGWTTGSDLDKYETADVTITKNITGNMADRNHEFPFSFNVTDPETGSLYSYKDDDGDVVAGAAFGTAINTGYESIIALENGSSFKIYGLPKNATKKSTVTVSEKNDTYDTYTYTTSGFDTDKSTAMNFDATLKTSETLTLADVNTDKSASFTNKLEEISPTGVVLRVAPYALMLAAGIILLVLMRRRTSKEEV